MLLDLECRRCALSEGRIQVVPPCGDKGSPVALVGEAPGAKEDEMGIPFVGRAGKILNGLMEEVGLSRDSVLVTNTVKCRPPGNRRPRPEEMEACRGFLEEELKDRHFILALGLSAAEDLIGRKLVMKEVANTLLEIEMGGKRISLMVTYHPSACIYRPPAKDTLREALRVASTYL